MNFVYKMNLQNDMAKGAFIHSGDYKPLSPVFDYTYELWKWIDSPASQFEFDEIDEDGKFTPFRMKLK